MAEYYKKINWKDGADGGTPLSAENLNKMEEGISGAEMRTGPLEYDKENDTFSAGDRIQLDANGNLKISGTITDGNGNVLGAFGEEDFPFYVAKTEVTMNEGSGYATFVLNNLPSKYIDFDIEPILSTARDVIAEYAGGTRGDEDTPGLWYMNAVLTTNNPSLVNSVIPLKALIWKK